MTADPKQTLHEHLQRGRDTVMFKVDGLSERELRLPRTPTGTNLLGLVKHLAYVEVGYLGDCLGRPAPVDVSAVMGPDAEDNADMFATATQSRDDIFELYRTVWAHDDASIEALDLDAEGRVPWWPDERDPVNLHTLLVHCIAETHRHAGQLDIMREGVDGSVGFRGPGGNLPSRDEAWWAAYRARLTAIAMGFDD